MPEISPLPWVGWFCCPTACWICCRSWAFFSSMIPVPSTLRTASSCSGVRLARSIGIFVSRLYDCLFEVVLHYRLRIDILFPVLLELSQEGGIDVDILNSAPSALAL